VHVALRRRDVCVPQQTTGVLDSLLAADFRPALVTGKVKHQIARQTGLIPKPWICAAQIRDLPPFTDHWLLVVSRSLAY
jgi:hypothetical protein